MTAWSGWQYLAATLILFVATAAVAQWIKVSDRPLAGSLAPHSAKLEWIHSPEKARDIVNDWIKRGVFRDALRGTLIDTFVFIPLYSTLIAVAAFGVGSLFPEGSTWRAVLHAAAWCGWIAGALDLIENAGIFAEMLRGWFFVAAPTAAVAIAKWIVAIGASLVVIAGGVARLFLR
jgi:hypothetical protein